VFHPGGPENERRIDARSVRPNRPSVTIGLPASTGAGGRLAAVPRHRFAPLSAATGLAWDALPASERTVPSSFGLMKHVGQGLFTLRG